MTRLKPKLRKSQILKGALKCAEETNYKTFTRSDVADLLAISDGLINAYFNTMPQLRRAVMRAAVQTSCLAVVAQGLADKDPQALKASPELKKLALESLL